MALWTPAVLTTALWLDADDSGTITLDGSAVTEWRDKSGNGRHATQVTAGSRPGYNAAELNSKGGITFRGGTKFLNASGFAIDPGSPFYLNIVTVLDASPGPYPAAVNFAGGAAGWVLFASAETVYTDYSFGSSATTWVRGRFGTDGPLGKTTMLSVGYNGGGATSLANFSAKVNGAAKTIASSSAFSTVPNATAIGAQQNATLPWVGSQHEIIVTTSNTDALKIEGYLAHKWGLQGSLPSDHPYKNSPPALTSVSGIVTNAEGDPAARIVRAYRRSTGELLAETTSDAMTGYYELELSTDAEIQRVVLDSATADPLYNDLIDRVIPQ
jgi:hypothetical protein